MKDKDYKKNLHTNPFTTFFVKMFYSFMKSAVSEMHFKTKKSSEDNDKLSTIEHLILKLEKQVQDNRHIISSLHDKLIWSQVLIIILLISIILQITL
ncbi:MAG: hypothetical protein U9N34_11185 [Candidatus Cloacimonadota bacterium]|nr:hypothetical protein [Candidatus Cloacimonadota bacterium]